MVSQSMSAFDCGVVWSGSGVTWMVVVFIPVEPVIIATRASVLFGGLFVKKAYPFRSGEHDRLRWRENPSRWSRRFYYPHCSSCSLSAAAIIALTARWKSAAAVDGPVRVEPDRFMGRVDHGVRGVGQRLQGRHRQPSISGRIGLEVPAIGFGNGAADEINHAPHVGCASSWHGR